MEIRNYKTFREIVDSNVPIELKIHVFEGDISELVYRLWCRVTGGKFERRQINRENTCVLVTKRGFHPISILVGLFRGHSISGSELEVFKRNCPGPKPPAVRRTMYWHWWDKYLFKDEIKCDECGRLYKVHEDDRKIVGKF